MGCSANPQRRW